MSAKFHQRLADNVFTSQPSVAKAYAEDKYKRFKKVSMLTYEKDALLEFLQVTNPYSFAWICHDKDTNADGTPVKPHYHAVVKYDNGVRVSHMAKVFTENVCFEVPYNEKAIEDYLLHMNSPEKYQYDPSEVTQYTESGRRAMFVSREEYQAETMTELLNDLQTLSMRELALKYGRDMMLNYDRYRKFVKEMVVEEENAKEV